MIKNAIYLPEKIMHNRSFKDIYDDWNDERVYTQTGIKQRHYAVNTETSATMGYHALSALIDKYKIDINCIDFIICVTETPDNMLPATAFKIHQLANLPQKCGAYDINQGCSGFTYGLLAACNLIKSGNASNVVLINTDTLSKYLDEDDRGVTTLIGDAASAALIDKSVQNSIMHFIYGTDSAGYDKIIIKHKNNDKKLPQYLYMDGMDVFYFAINKVPKLIDELLNINKLTLNDIDMVILHQANKTILEYIKKRLKLSDDKFYINMENTGNTASATIPIAINELTACNKLQDGMLVLVLGFGVGYSWCGTVIRW